jgi:hypothetical protein
LKQVEEESNHYENKIEEYQIERNQLINDIRQINNDFNLTKQTIQQRNFIIQEKVFFLIFGNFHLFILLFS